MRSDRKLRLPKQRPGKRWLFLGAVELAAALAYLGILVWVLRPQIQKLGQEYENEAAVAAVKFIEASLSQPAGIAAADAGEGKNRGPSFAPHSVPATDPSNLIEYTEVLDGETLYNNADGYQAREELSFGLGEEYTDIDGVLTFRGDNFRNSPAFGYAVDGTAADHHVARGDKEEDEPV